LSLLIVGPEIGILGFLIKFGRFIPKPVNLKDTPEVFRGVISDRLYQ